MSKRRGKSAIIGKMRQWLASDGLISTALEDLIPQAHPVRLLDEILDHG